MKYEVSSIDKFIRHKTQLNHSALRRK